mgnify:CR=1 FL=1
MKSHFSRFLHHTLSHSGIREVFTSSLSLSDLIGEPRSNKVANLSHLDYRVKPDNDGFCTGRSMVEMLGVLAIIGVLSVGAIAGYSKAMMKYKLNQHAQAVNMLINNVLSIKDKLQYNKNGETYYGTLLYKTNLLPDGIKYISNTSLQDNWFKNRIIVYYNNVKWTTSNGTETQNDFGGIGFYFAPSSGGAEICRNIVIAAKENASDLWFVQTYKSSNDTSSADTYIGHLYGDAYCSASTDCLHDLDLNKVSNLCNTCNERMCMLDVLWK